MFGIFHEIEKRTGMAWEVLGGCMRLTFFGGQLLTITVSVIGHNCGSYRGRMGCLFAPKMALSGHGRGG